MAEHTWRPLGEILVARGMIDEHQLGVWLKQQQLRGMLLGELLVQNRIVSPMEVAAALAVQRGAGELARGIDSVPRQLGRALVEQGLLTESGLQRALLEQQRHGGSLGDILVQRGYVTRVQIDEVLAGNEQSQSTEAEPPGEKRYEVLTPGATAPLYASGSFLEATDYAFDLIEDDDPDSLEIIEMNGDQRRIAWSYARPTPAPA